MSFQNSDQATAFIATADSRHTDESVMRAIVAVSDTLENAENMWENGLEGLDSASLVNFREIATGNGADESPLWGDREIEWPEA